MLPVRIKDNIYWIGVNDFKTTHFEGMWPIHEEGISYNSYLINDQKKAVIDLANEYSDNAFLDQISRVFPPAEIDYIIMNHIEPDHTGATRLLLEHATNAVILATARGQQILDAFYGLGSRVRVVEDGERLSLGSTTLQFVSTPNVHWPETMMTYAEEAKILFSCDGFGGYGALHGGIYDLDYEDTSFYKQEALRYYVNIIATFSRPTLKAIEKICHLDLSIVAPAHGLVWRKNPEEIIDLYRGWAQMGLEPAEKGVTLLYGSMYGNTERMMNAVAQGISREGVSINLFNVPETHISYILPSLWTQHGVMIGAPTYEGGLFPPMKYVLEMAEIKRVTGKLTARFGSYGWKSGGSQKQFEELIAPLKWELTDVFDFNGGPTEEDFKQGVEFGAAFARKVKNS